jgi:membrane-associated protease RseP (regulator of RpoE activity)
MTLFAPAPERVQQVLKGEALSPGWLAFDRRRRPAGSTASSITPAARAEIGSRLAKALDVQGVAELTARPGADQFLLSILAAGSTEPDVVEVRLDSAAALGDILARLDQVPPMHRPSVGLSVADVLDVTGAVVTAVDQDGAAAKAGLVAGDVITAIDGQPVADGSSFGALVAQRKSGDKLSAEVKGKAGGVKGATLTVAMAPRLVAMNDQSVLFNHLVLSLRSRLAAQSGGGVADSIMRLNLAVGLMRLGNWPGALAELSKVQLPAGPGVSTGTVQYLLGLSYEALGQAAEAERAFRAAADTASLLTEDGPAVKELAERKLARGRR